MAALVVVLAVDVEPGLPVVVAQVALRLRQHPAGAAGGVEEGAHHAGGGEQGVVVDEQQAHHQPDDLARGEVVARGLVGKLVEAADQVLEDEPHLLVRHPVRVQIDAAELRDDHVEDVRFAHLLDLGLELEVLDEDAAHVGGEALEVAHQVLGDVVGVALELLEVEGRAVVEALAGGLVEDAVQGLAPEPAALAPLVLGQHPGLGGREHAVEAAQHGHRQHHPLVLRRAVGAAQQVRDLPDQVGEVGVVGCRAGIGHRSGIRRAWRGPVSPDSMRGRP